MAPSTKEMIERYLKLDSALIYDTLNAMGLPDQQLSLDIQPLDIDMVVAGPAFTTQSAVSEAADKVESDRLTFSGGSYHKAMSDGCVLVQDVGGDRVTGGLGENAGMTVQMHGCAGVVCDGGTRDRKALIQAGFPVFSRFSTCTLSWGKKRLIDYQIPVRMSGHLTRWVTVHPGDFIFGDVDGILVIPQDLTLETLEGAEGVQENEEIEREHLLTTGSRPEGFQRKRFAHIRRVVE